MAKKYTPTRTAREAIQRMFADTNPQDFYSRVKQITGDDAERIRYNLGKNFTALACKCREINPDVSEGSRFLRIIQELYQLNEADSKPILSGIKEFFQRDYTAEEFEAAVNILVNISPREMDQKYKEEIATVLEEAVKRNKERDPKDLESLSRRSWLAEKANVLISSSTKTEPNHQRAIRMAKAQDSADRDIEEQYMQTTRRYEEIISKRG